MPLKNKPESRRQRTVTWQDPMISAKAAATMEGLAYLRAIKNGTLPRPPIADLLGYTITEIEVSRAVFVLDPAEYHYNPIGMVHGGVASTILDSAMACSIHTTLPAGRVYTTLEFKVNFVRPMTDKTGRVRCVAEIIHVGQRVGTAQAKILDSQDRLYAHATTTCMIFEAPQQAE
ncbi:MAG: PaaI family thioesterase [Desulfobacterales bacterium]|nr:PaaI family thioesterase [Desulfobacterales bacterium]